MSDTWLSADTVASLCDCMLRRSIWRKELEKLLLENQPASNDVFAYLKSKLLGIDGNTFFEFWTLAIPASKCLVTVETNSHPPMKAAATILRRATGFHDAKKSCQYFKILWELQTESSKRKWKPLLGSKNASNQWTVVVTIYSYVNHFSIPDVLIHWTTCRFGRYRIFAEDNPQGLRQAAAATPNWLQHMDTYRPRCSAGLEFLISRQPKREALLQQPCNRELLSNTARIWAATQQFCTN